MYFKFSSLIDRIRIMPLIDKILYNSSYLDAKLQMQHIISCKDH